MTAILCLLAALPAAEWLTPDRAVAAALADAERLPAAAQPFTRYVWHPDSSPDVHKLSSFTVNSAVSELRNAAIVRPEPLAAGHLSRLDLRRLAPTDPVRLAKLWDQLVDPYLYLEESPPKARRQKPRFPDDYELRTVPPYQQDGKTWTARWIPKPNTEHRTPNTQPAIRFAAHLGPSAAFGDRLQLLTASAVPIVRVDELIRRSLTALDDGLYYQFLDIPADYDAFLKLFGTDRKVVDQLDSERRAALLKSRVTDVPRAILVIPTLGVGPDLSGGNHWISEDIGKDDRDVKQHPLRNLLNAAFRAGEACTEANNGRLVWTLWAFQVRDGRLTGTLQKSVPDDIAQDGTVPHPHDRRLQSSVSCWRCHLIEKHDGFKPFESVVDTLAKAGFDILGDASLNKPAEDVLRELVSKYRWDGRKLLTRSRDDFAEFVTRTTGTWTPNDVGSAITAHFQHYWYDGVSPEVACRELGLRLFSGHTTADAAKKLRQSVPPIPVEIAPGFLPEDPILAALKAGQTVTRRDWESIYQEAFRRCRSVP